MSCEEREELLGCEERLEEADIKTINYVCGVEESEGAHRVAAAAGEDDQAC